MAGLLETSRKPRPNLQPLAEVLLYKTFMAKKQIFIAEDDSFVAEDLRNRLESLDYTVSGATPNGLEAVDLAQSLRPDMVLMDIQLPGEIDGIEAAGQLRNLDVPVVYVTGYCEGPLLQRAKMTEPYGYILKPYQTRELETTIELGLYKHRADQERGRMLKDIQEKLANCKTLAGLLPICCICKKVRDDKNYWHQVESFVARNTEATFTHSYCPDCLGKLMTEVESMDGVEAKAKR